MFVNYFSLFGSCCNSVIIDNHCLSSVGNNGFDCSVAENTIFSDTGDALIRKSFDVPTLDCGSSSNQSVTWLDFVVSMDGDRLIEDKMMSSEGGTAEHSISVSKSKILVEWHNGKVWQPSSKYWDCDFYLYQRAFPRTWGAGIQWWL